HALMDTLVLEHGVHYGQIVASTEVQLQNNAQVQIREAVLPNHAPLSVTVNTHMGIEVPQENNGVLGWCTRTPPMDSKKAGLGRPGVDCYCQHESGAAVLQLQFLINEGALVTACADDTLHLWNLRQRRPAVLHSLKFNRERITFCHLPFQSKWLYVGTERGNTHIVNIESFILSGYVIMWNKAIELSTKTHPGPVVHLSDSPKDEGKLLIGFESGTIVQWDLRAKKADFRIYYDEAIHSVSWHHEGKQFMCSHSDGSLTLWNLRNTTKPLQVTFPHGKIQKDGKKESCKPILKVEYKTSRSRYGFITISFA
uniref:Uncharacterized protein n=1 Tax=Periophthalmus magnuspinnatus TaxID=409849 RepID=A0A3B4ARS2_9GOBI